MIRATLAGLAGAWIARDAGRGNIPNSLAVPLTLVASRLPLPALVAGALGYGIYRLKTEARVMRARDVTPERAAEPTIRKPAVRKTSRKPRAAADGRSPRRAGSGRRPSPPATEPANDVSNGDRP